MPGSTKWTASPQTRIGAACAVDFPASEGDPGLAGELKPLLLRLWSGDAINNGASSQKASADFASSIYSPLFAPLTEARGILSERLNASTSGMIVGINRPPLFEPPLL